MVKIISTYKESEYYKSYADGTVYINDDEVSDTFIFRVDLKNERTYMSVIAYLILACAILGIEYISLKEYLWKKP